MAGDRTGASEPQPHRKRAFETGPQISEALSALWFQALYETPLMFSGILDDQGRVLDANHLSIEGCGLDRAQILGRPFWEGGWWSPDPALAAQVRQWCVQVLATGEPLRLPTHYFVRGATPRMVDLALLPVRDDEGDVTYIVATGSDITESLAEHRGALAAVQASERRAGDRLSQLMGAALALINAETAEDLRAIVVDEALPVLGADGGAIAVREADTLRLAVSDRFGTQPPDSLAHIPLDSPRPVAYTSRTGRRLLLPTRKAGLAFAPVMAEVYAETGRGAWAYLPLRVSGQLLGCLAVSWRDERVFDAAELVLLEAFAAQCAQALDRIQHLREHRAAALAVQRMSETLQRSLLTQPPTSDWLDVAVRYQPAAQEAEVGGDWYDAFLTAGGATMLAVGDVTGHDRVAAAAMGQIRNMLRGMTVDSPDSPAELLRRLDRALQVLQIGTLASAVLARVEPEPRQGPTGVRRLCWSNAGHPPPLLRQPDGTVEVLEGEKEPLLGIDPDMPRNESAVELTEGSTLLLYTDGLIERRDVDLKDSIDALAKLFADVGDRAPQHVCDALLAAVPTDHEDDIALLVLRCGGRAGADRG